MDYRTARIFDSSGKDNSTRSIPIHYFQKLYAIQTVNLGITVEKNHPKILAELYSFLYYGNNDTQRLLCNMIEYDICMKNKIIYEDFIIKFNLHGVPTLSNIQFLIS